MRLSIITRTWRAAARRQPASALRCSSSAGLPPARRAELQQAGQIGPVPGALKGSLAHLYLQTVEYLPPCCREKPEGQSQVGPVLQAWNVMMVWPSPRPILFSFGTHLRRQATAGLTAVDLWWRRAVRLLVD